VCAGASAQDVVSLLIEALGVDLAELFRGSNSGSGSGNGYGSVRASEEDTFAFACEHVVAPAVEPIIDAYFGVDVKDDESVCE
jgi:hypothetical protein